MNINDTTEVLAEEKHTCREHCRAKDFNHAATFNTTCFCMNTSSIDGIKVNDDSCDNSDTLQFLDVHDLGKNLIIQRRLLWFASYLCTKNNTPTI